MNKIIIALISLALIASPVFASEVPTRWSVDIGAKVTGATAVILGAGSGAILPGEPCENCGFSYAVGATGGIVNGDGSIDINGGGSNDGGGMGVEISGSGASGDLIFATHDLTVDGCCQGCVCPTGYEYKASSGATVTDGTGVNIELHGGAGTDGAGQKLEVGEKRDPINAGSVAASMSSSLTVNGETQTHSMGASGQNVWFTAFGKQGFNADGCGVDGFFVSVMGYQNSLCADGTCE